MAEAQLLLKGEETSESILAEEMEKLSAEKVGPVEKVPIA